MPPMTGQLTGGLRWDAGAAPRAFVDLSQKLTGHVSLFAAGDIANMDDWHTVGGVRVTW